MPRLPPGQAGFTLVELMISLVISSVLVAAGLSMGSTVMASSGRTGPPATTTPMIPALRITRPSSSR